MKFIEFLNDNSGALTFLVTAVYVIATIFICWANIKSANAAREQVEESKHQFQESNRAVIVHEFIFERRIWYGMRFTNTGKCIAKHVQIQFDNAFLDSLKETQFTKHLRQLHGKEFILGVNQSYDIFFGSSEFRSNTDKLPVEGNVIYSDMFSEYREHFCIDFNNYPPIFTVDSDNEKLIDEIKNQTKEIERIRKELNSMQTIMKQERKNV